MADPQGLWHLVSTMTQLRVTLKRAVMPFLAISLGNPPSALASVFSFYSMSASDERLFVLLVSLTPVVRTFNRSCTHLSLGVSACEQNVRRY